jgi:hypothetical protein
MTHTDDPTQAEPPPARLPDFSSFTTPEEKAQAWAELIRNGDGIPEEALDRALTKLLEEIRLSL